MTGRRWRRAALTAVVGSSITSPLHAQTAATLGMSASVVEYEGFLASGAATLTPTLRFDATDLSLGAQGSWTVFESGNHILQATAAAAWLSPPRRRWWHLELSAAAGASRYADEPGSGHALAHARLHRVAETKGLWGGITAGFISDSSRDQPAQLEFGGWTVHERLTFVGTVTRTWLGGDAHVDILGAARWATARAELEIRLGVRPWAESGGDIGEAVEGAFGELSALVSLNSRIAVAVSAGSYAADPVRRLLAARYINAGLRLSVLRTEAARVPLLTDPDLAAARARVVSGRRSGRSAPPALEIVRDERFYILQVHVADVDQVELMADFTDWQPVALTRVHTDRWELKLELTPGVHRLNIRIGGGEWLVPAGARAEPGEFGGEVGVIVVRSP